MPIVKEKQKNKTIIANRPQLRFFLRNLKKSVTLHLNIQKN